MVERVAGLAVVGKVVRVVMRVDLLDLLGPLVHPGMHLLAVAHRLNCFTFIKKNNLITSQFELLFIRKGWQRILVFFYWRLHEAGLWRPANVRRRKILWRRSYKSLHFRSTLSPRYHAFLHRRRCGRRPPGSLALRRLFLSI